MPPPAIEYSNNDRRAYRQNTHGHGPHHFYDHPHPHMPPHMQQPPPFDHPGDGRISFSARDRYFPERNRDRDRSGPAYQERGGFDNHQSYHLNYGHEQHTPIGVDNGRDMALGMGMHGDTNHEHRFGRGTYRRSRHRERAAYDEQRARRKRGRAGLKSRSRSRRRTSRTRSRSRSSPPRHHHSYRGNPKRRRPNFRSRSRSSLYPIRRRRHNRRSKSRSRSKSKSSPPLRSPSPKNHKHDRSRSRSCSPSYGRDLSSSQSPSRSRSRLRSRHRRSRSRDRRHHRRRKTDRESNTHRHNKRKHSLSTSKQRSRSVSVALRESPNDHKKNKDYLVRSRERGDRDKGDKEKKKVGEDVKNQCDKVQGNGINDFGVVSDDENLFSNKGRQNGAIGESSKNSKPRRYREASEDEEVDRESRRRKKKKKVKRRRSSRERDGRKINNEHGIRNTDGRSRHNDSNRRKRDTGNGRGRARKGGHGSSGGSTSSRDDSYGHFEGGPGTVVVDRYKIIKDVGLGTFGRVVQAVDLHQHDRREQSRVKKYRDKDKDRRKVKKRIENTVAIKIVRNVKRYHESALIEADILKDVNRRGGRGRSLCVVMLRHFDLQRGHCCLVFECLGRSLYDFMKTHGFKPFPLFCVRDFARQILDALDFIHSFGLIHTDLKPENIMLVSNKERSYRCNDGSDQQIPASTCIKLIDFGGATYDNDKKSSVINTRQYRAPEVILGSNGWSLPSDLWSTGCIIAELYKGDLLFQTHDNTEHLALIEKIIGRFPLNMLRQSKNIGSTFDVHGWHSMDLPVASKVHVRKARTLESIVQKNDRGVGFEPFLRSLLIIDPALRTSAGDALCCSFIASEIQLKEIE